MNNLISVIVPVYNGQRYLAECLKSILRQTYGNIEVIVVNDGSTDRTPAILSSFVARDRQMVVVNQSNGGVASARKSGFLKAGGEYIVFVDADDVLPHNAIEILSSRAEETNADVVCGTMNRQFLGVIKKARPDSRHHLIKAPELWEKYYVSFFGINLFPVNMYGKIYKRSVINEAMAVSDIFCEPRLHMGEDEAFNLQLFPHIKTALLIDEKVYVYRWGGLTSGYNRYLPELLDFCDFRINLLDKYRYSAGYQPLFIEYVNVVVSHIVQSLSFGKMTGPEAKAWVAEEIESRYLVRRMRQYYTDSETKVPSKCRMVLSLDYEAVMALAKGVLKKNRFVFLIKKIAGSF